MAAPQLYNLDPESTNEKFIVESFKAHLERREAVSHQGRQIPVRETERTKVFATNSAIEASITVSAPRPDRAGRASSLIRARLTGLSGSQEDQIVCPSFVGMVKEWRDGRIGSFFFDPGAEERRKGMLAIIERAAESGVSVSDLLTPEEADDLAKGRILNPENPVHQAILDFGASSLEPAQPGNSFNLPPCTY